MDDSCYICGMVLARIDDDFPQWCKEVNALCWFEDQLILSGTGYVDDDVTPFHLPLPLQGFNHFWHRQGPLDESPSSCYPFHAACLRLLRENDHDDSLDQDVQTLFNIFESIYRATHALRWGHNYHFEDMLDAYSLSEQKCLGKDIISENKTRLAILADPSRFHLLEDEIWNIGPPRSCSIQLSVGNYGKPFPSSRIELLPPEILQLVMSRLDFRAACNLLLASKSLYQQYEGDPYKLPNMFWESRFWTYGEFGFARSICPESFSWKDWFLRINLEQNKGANQMNLRNRKRIWKLVVDLMNLARTVKDPGRVLVGHLAGSPPIRGSTMSCLAQKNSFEGCRELIRRTVCLRSGSQICAVIPSYILFLNKRLVSGITFAYNNGEVENVGYVLSGIAPSVNSKVSAKYLWLVSSPLGFVSITINELPSQLVEASLSHASNLAIARWPLEHLREASVGLDAFRLVRICMDFQRQHSFNDISWVAPYPLSSPSLHEDDISALHRLQGKSFAPASTHSIDFKQGQLASIKIYSALGDCAGISGIGLYYDSGIESLWGSANDTATLAFFLAGAERIVRVDVYKTDSLVCCLQFTTNLQRTSGLLPQLPINTNISLDHIEYEASDNGHITGFCGCFLDSSQLFCFGVISTTTVVLSKRRWIIQRPPTSASVDLEMPLAGFRNHGCHRTRILLGKKYRSVQASIIHVASRYRRVGQVTGLLFRSSDNPDDPDLLGQWTGPGALYNFDEAERILGLDFTTIKPIQKVRTGSGLSQVAGITIFTNRKNMHWSQEFNGQEILDATQCKQSITEVSWEFNAIFDRVRCIYQ